MSEPEAPRGPFCKIPGCVEEADGALLLAHATPLLLCSEHLRPLRAAALDLYRRRRPEVAHA